MHLRYDSYHNMTQTPSHKHWRVGLEGPVLRLFSLLIWSVVWGLPGARVLLGLLDLSAIILFILFLYLYREK